MKTVIVAGGFDPPHRGHCDHLKKAKALGDRLTVITHPDYVLVKKKGYCLLPLADRIENLRENRRVDDVVVSIDEDGTVTKTLEMIRQTVSGDLIFAKGGDRTPETMPEGEIIACKKLGIKIVYGIGDKLGSSRDLVANAMKQLRGLS